MHGMTLQENDVTKSHSGSILETAEIIEMCDA